MPKLVPVPFQELLTTSEDGGESKEEDDERHGVEEEEDVDEEAVGVGDHAAHVLIPLHANLITMIGILKTL